jgi:hypothetical protein
VEDELVYSPSGGAFVMCFVCGQAAECIVVLQFGHAGSLGTVERGSCETCAKQIVMRLVNPRQRWRWKVTAAWVLPVQKYAF